MKAYAKRINSGYSIVTPGHPAIVSSNLLTFAPDTKCIVELNTKAHDFCIETYKGAQNICSIYKDRFLNLLHEFRHEMHASKGNDAYQYVLANANLPELLNETVNYNPLQCALLNMEANKLMEEKAFQMFCGVDEPEPEPAEDKVENTPNERENKSSEPEPQEANEPQKVDDENVAELSGNMPRQGMKIS